MRQHLLLLRNLVRYWQHRLTHKPGPHVCSHGEHALINSVLPVWVGVDWTPYWSV